MSLSLERLAKASLIFVPLFSGCHYIGLGKPEPKNAEQKGAEIDAAFVDTNLVAVKCRFRLIYREDRIKHPDEFPEIIEMKKGTCKPLLQPSPSDATKVKPDTTSSYKSLNNYFTFSTNDGS